MRSSPSSATGRSSSSRRCCRKRSCAAGVDETGGAYRPALGRGDVGGVLRRARASPSLPIGSTCAPPTRRRSDPASRRRSARSGPARGRLRRHEHDARRSAREQSRKAYPSPTSRQGLRSGDLEMPEERNRIEVDGISTVLFAPDERSAATLHAEGVPGEVHVVGDVMADVARCFAPLAREAAPHPRGAWARARRATSSQRCTGRRTSGRSACGASWRPRPRRAPSSCRTPPHAAGARGAGNRAGGARARDRAARLPRPGRRSPPRPR